MKRMLAATILLGLTALTGCSATAAPEDDPSASAPLPASAPPSETSPASESSSTPEAAAAGGGIKGACGEFNTLWADYAAVAGDDPNAYEEIYLASEDAKDTAPEEVSGLFAALSLIAIDHAGAAENGGQPEQASQDAVRDAVFANSGACTAEGVTLTL